MKLATSQSDRTNFDAAVSRWAQECARAAGYCALTDSMLSQYRDSYLENIEVGDLAEAEARFFSAFAESWKHEVLDHFACELEDEDHPVVVFDTGQEIFGTFHDGFAAAAAVRMSDPSSWAMVEPPSWENPEATWYSYFDPDDAIAYVANIGYGEDMAGHPLDLVPRWWDPETGILEFDDGRFLITVRFTPGGEVEFVRKS